MGETEIGGVAGGALDGAVIDIGENRGRLRPTAKCRQTEDPETATGIEDRGWRSELAEVIQQQPGAGIDPVGREDTRRRAELEPIMTGHHRDRWDHG